ncbi:hypothetical protein DFH09DRAFT_944986, partial [Mycena vulgaris]
LFKQKFSELTQGQKDTVHTAGFHDYIWRNGTGPGIMACFATGAPPCLKTVKIDVTATITPPCGACRLLVTVKAFKTAIQREAPEPFNL